MPDTPADALAGWQRAVLHGRGLAAVSTLPALLPELRLLRPTQLDDTGADGVLAWGRKPSARRAQAWAQAHGLPVVQLEDGFVRSVGLGHQEPPCAIVVDDQGIYYDASRPSRLDQLLRTPPDAAAQRRGQALVQAWQTQRVSKYNHGREDPTLAQPGDVLVVDQTAGDAAIGFGGASADSFRQMLQAALDEHPQARILLKIHPDVLAGRKQGHFDLAALSDHPRIQVLATPVHPPSLLERVAAVYTVTSQMGFEALLWGRPVRCFGMPFYAGRGLTHDEQPAPAWRQRVGLPQLAHAALVAYSRCVHPETGQRCEVEDLLAWMGLQRQQRERFAPELLALGFSRWKQPMVRRFLAGSQLRFTPLKKPAAANASVVLWGQQPLPAWARQAPPAQVIRLEDGFLRSVGLGADLVQPLSWVADPVGLYYNARQPSALEQLLAHTDFSPDLLARARALRERILALGLTKYNVGPAGWLRPAVKQTVVLVVGQVETDAAIRFAAPQIRTNMGLLKAVREARPDAWLVYKPHPDVVARLRAVGVDERQALQWCDEQLLHADMHSVLSQVDEVHVLTSLAGFEALMRGKQVVTWGQPFYAGWGLTEDRCPVARRQRHLSLDALVAAVLILYPSYVSRITGRFCTPERALTELEAWRQRAPAPTSPSLWRQAWRLMLGWGVQLRRRWQSPD